MKYVIDSKTYEKHIREKAHLYGLLRQLASLAGKAADGEDVRKLVEAAQDYGRIAEGMFDAWGIPGSYLVFGDRADLAGLKEAELEPLALVLKAHDREKEHAASVHDTAYIIPGYSFRLLVSDLFSLLGQYSLLRDRVLALETEAQAARLKKRLSKESRMVRRMYRGWGIPEGMGITSLEMLKKAIEHTHLKPYAPEGMDGGEDGFCPDDGLYADDVSCGGDYE